ncbi:MAG TPA: diguanylate cyclase [Acidimicrobiales bacterium]|nr:diguanylate cyclase [Acidimicrobiales bacterium]
MTIDAAALMAVSPDPTIVLDAQGRVGYVNAAMEELVGAKADDYVGTDTLSFIHPDDVMHVLTSLESIQNRGGRPGTPIEVRIRDKNGAWHWLEVVGRDCRDVEGIGGILCTARDLTRRRMWEIAGNDVVRFQQVVHHARALVLCLDADGIVSNVNAAFGRLLGFDPSRVIGSPLSDFAMPEDEIHLREAIRAARAGNRDPVEVDMRRAHMSSPLPIRFEITSLLDDEVVHSMVVTGQDVSDLRDARRRLEYMATHDSMTGLPNREFLYAWLGERLLSGSSVAVLYADLDGFKSVNDTLGHDAGDELLVLAAKRLSGAVSSADLVSRLGGDEFVVAAVGMRDRQDVAAVAERLARVLEEPFKLTSGVARISVSVGSVIAEDGDTVPRLLSRADRDMYSVKNRVSRSG